MIETTIQVTGREVVVIDALAIVDFTAMNAAGGEIPNGEFVVTIVHESTVEIVDPDEVATLKPDGTIEIRDRRGRIRRPRYKAIVSPNARAIDPKETKGVDRAET